MGCVSLSGDLYERIGAAQALRLCPAVLAVDRPRSWGEFPLVLHSCAKLKLPHV